MRIEERQWRKERVYRKGFFFNISNMPRVVFVVDFDRVNGCEQLICGLIWKQWNAESGIYGIYDKGQTKLFNTESYS